MKPGGLLGPGPKHWRPLAYVLAFVALAAMSVVYTRHVQQQSERKWCEFITTLDDAWSSTPPQSALGRQVAASLHKLRDEFGC